MAAVQLIIMSVGGIMTGNQRKRLIEALKAERNKLDRMTDKASDTGKDLSTSDILHQSGIVGSLINDLDCQSKPINKSNIQNNAHRAEDNENNV
jgi:hypothetical protein